MIYGENRRFAAAMLFELDHRTVSLCILIEHSLHICRVSTFVLSPNVLSCIQLKRLAASNKSGPLALNSSRNLRR